MNHSGIGGKTAGDFVTATLSSLAYGSPDKAANLGPVMFDECGALTPEWRAVLVTHADQLMYGSDAYATWRGGWRSYSRIIARYRRLAGQLPADVARKISRDNAAALYGVR